MRRLVLFAVVGLTVVVAQLTPAFAAKGPVAPVVLSGSLSGQGLSATGSASGRVFVYANGQVVSSAIATPSFAVRLPWSSGLSKLAVRNGGYVNFDALVSNGSKLYLFGFSKRFDSATKTWKTGKATPTPRSIDVSRLGTSSSRAAAVESRLITCGRVLLSTAKNVSTTAGEIHTYGSSVADTVTYGKTADSNISVGVSSDGSNWSMNGTYHVGNSNSAAVSWSKAGPYGHRVQSNFNYNKYEWMPLGCGGYEIDAVQWDGSATYGSDNSSSDGQCSTTYAQYESQYGAHTSFTRSTNRYTTFSVAATAFGVVGFTAQSGASTYVQMKWNFNQSSGTRSLCGNNNFPTYSARIFQGG